MVGWSDIAVKLTMSRHYSSFDFSRTKACVFLTRDRLVVIFFFFFFFLILYPKLVFHIFPFFVSPL